MELDNREIIEVDDSSDDDNADHRHLPMELNNREIIEVDDSSDDDNADMERTYRNDGDGNSDDDDDEDYVPSDAEHEIRNHENVDEEDVNDDDDSSTHSSWYDYTPTDGRPILRAGDVIKYQDYFDNTVTRSATVKKVYAWRNWRTGGFPIELNNAFYSPTALDMIAKVGRWNFDTGTIRSERNKQRFQISTFHLIESELTTTERAVIEESLRTRQRDPLQRLVDIIRDPVRAVATYYIDDDDDRET